MSSPKYFENEIIWKREENDDHSDMWDDTALIEAYDRAVSHVKEQIAKRNKVVSDSDGKASVTSSHKRKKRGRSKNKTTWKVGDYCQAIYSEDGLPYEAVIKHINNGICTVQFLGYKNEENIKIENICHSKGKEARIQQNIAAQKYNANYEHSDEMNCNYYAEDTSSSVGTNHKHSHGYKNQNGKNHFLTHQYPFHTSGQSSYSGPDQCHTFVPSSNMPPVPPFSCHHKRNCMQTIPPMPPPPFPIEDSIVNEDEALASMLMSWYMSGYHTGYYQGLRQSQINPCSSKLNKNCSCIH
ncbi:survival of motor neuron protein isoform X1 [Centruroides vittatus]|uniref:survival of motor neuron protein isoform X1 n=1 Tax=Centruroides vittatus TaxID=120091 RepID=UPI003510997E